MALEDYTTYTEVDQQNDITVTASKCDVVTMDNDVTSYVRGDKGADHFGDFEHLVTVHYGDAANYGRMGLWGLSDGASRWMDMWAGDGMNLYIWRSSAGARHVSIADGPNQQADHYDPSAGTTYYCTVERSGDTLTAKLYSDADRTNLLDTLSITCSTEQYRYVFGPFSNGSAGGVWITGYVENLDLQEAAAPQPYSFIM